MIQTNNAIELNKDFFAQFSSSTKDDKNIVSDRISLIFDSSAILNQTMNVLVKIIHVEFEIVVSGSAVYQIDGKDYAIKKDTVIIYQQYTFLKCVSKSDDFRYIGFDCDFAEIYDFNLLSDFTVIEDLDSLAVNEIMQLLCSMRRILLYEKKSIQTIKCLVMALFSFLATNIENKQAGNNQQSRTFNLYRQFVKLLRQNYDFSLSVKDYAEQLCVSVSYLRSSVKQFSGMSVGKLIHKEIIRRSEIMLSEGVNVKSIEERLNLKDPEYFYKFFRDQTGLTVAEYKKNKTDIVNHKLIS